MTYAKDRHASVLRSLLPSIGGDPTDSARADPYQALLGRLTADRDNHYYEAIEIARCYDNPEQIRRGRWRDEGALQDLMESLRRHGQINPVSVVRDGERYRIICGHRRIAAMKRLGWNLVHAKIHPPRSSEVELLELMADNLLRRSCTRIEIVAGLKKLARLGVSQEIMGRIIGLNQSTVSRYLQIADLPETYLLANEEGKITFKHLLTLAGVADPAERERTFERFLSAKTTRRPKRFAGAGLQVVWRTDETPTADDVRRLIDWLTEVARESGVQLTAEVREIVRYEV